MTRKHLLICDDEPHVLEGLRYLLRGAQRRITLAPNGRVALELIRKERPDLLITDVMMPELSGLELVAQLRGDAATRDLPIIIVTARGQPQDAVVARATWGAHVLAKPFDPRALRELVSGLLGDAACPAPSSA
jgi:CheY-like chemotaxis protein